MIIKTAIVILNWNGTDDTIECLESIFKNDADHTIFVLDNHSEAQSIMKLKRWIENTYLKQRYIIESAEQFSTRSAFKKETLHLVKHNENLGFAKGNNYIINHIYSHFDYVMLLNNDTYVTSNAITDMVACMEENEEIGVLSCNIRMYSDKKKLWNAGGKFAWYGDRKYFSQEFIDRCIKEKKYLISTPFVTGCAMMIRKEIIATCGSLTEQFFFGEEDFHYCKELQSHGVKVCSLLSATIFHKVGTSISKASRGEEMIFRKNILHFTNRIINLANFYPRAYWKIWRFFYIRAVSLKFYLNTKNLGLTKKLIKHLNYYTGNYTGVDYQLFLEINQLSVD